VLIPFHYNSFRVLNLPTGGALLSLTPAGSKSRCTLPLQ
jgi:hypothetical protein